MFDVCLTKNYCITGNMHKNQPNSYTHSADFRVSRTGATLISDHTHPEISETIFRFPQFEPSCKQFIL